MKSRLRLYQKSILSIILCGALLPANIVFAGDVTSIYGGAAGIGRNNDGSIGVDNSTYDLQVNNSDINVKMPERETKDLSGTLMEGIYVGDIDLSGLTYNQAVEKINKYVNDFSDGEIVLESIDGNSVNVTAKDLGISWNDSGILEEALSLGKKGNLVQKYKERKDIQNEKKVYDLKLIYDTSAIRAIVEEQGTLYNIESKDGSISRENGSFKIIPGEAGRVIDVESSVKEIEKNLEDYRGEKKVIALNVIEDDPYGKASDLEKIKDVIGTFTTSFSSSGSERSGNVRNGTNLVNGTLLLPGEQFSMYKTVSPFTEENGYYMAGSYLNGMVVESLGGGICQVSSTLYNAVIRAELQVDERYNHSMIVTYVKMSSDAAISGTSKDFKFTNNLDYPIYIEGYTTDDKKIVFNIYGVETRPSNRTLEFESVELSKTEPVDEKIVADPSQPLGYVSVQSPHIGYSGEFWKIVKVDGIETERIQLNKSNYQPAPRTATVGTATDNPAALAALQTAMATGSIDYVKSTIASLNAAAAAALGGQ